VPSLDFPEYPSYPHISGGGGGGGVDIFYLGEGRFKRKVAVAGRMRAI